jgi:adenylosuccinate synthase
LSVDYGTYPFVTSSDCSLSGLALGSGLGVKDVDYTASIVKAYATRVGEGPFPTELSGDIADTLRKGGNEYGATTKRPRRVGWLDLPLMRYGLKYSSRTLTLTEGDVLSGYESVSLCTAYRYEGPDYRVGERTLKKGDVLKTALPYPDVLMHCVPVYEELPGWGALDTSMDTKGKLPPALGAFVKRVEEELSATVDIFSLGADREATVIF